MNIQSICIFLCSLLFCVLLNAQKNNDTEITKDSIQVLLEQSMAFSDDELEGKDTLDKATKLLDRGYKLAQDTKDPYLLLVANTAKAYFYVYTRKFTQAQDYINRAITYKDFISDPKRLGQLYNMLGVVKAANEEHEKAIEAYLQAEIYYLQCPCEDALFYTYANLNFEYRIVKQYEKSILYGEKALFLFNKLKDYIVKLGNGESLNTHIYIRNATSHIDLKQLRLAEKYIEIIDDNSYSYNKDNIYLQSAISFLKATYYNAIADNKTALIYIKEAYNYNKIYNDKRVNTINNALELDQELNLKTKQNKTKQLEIKLQKEQIKNVRYLFSFGAVFIFGLAASIIISKRNTKKQTKTNLLLKEKYKEIEKNTQRVTSALKVKTNFLESFSHELKTPLNTIKNIVYLLQSKDNSTERVYRLEILDNASNHLLSLINDIIDLKLLTDNKREFKKEPIDIAKTINNVLDALLIGCENKNIIVLREIDNNIPKYLEGDTNSLTQIIINLVENALKFTKDGKIRIVVKLKSIDKYKVTIAYIISDTGIGIPKNQQDKIFERFTQGSKDINREFGGSGIGLAIVKDLLEAQDSRIHLSSKEGKGATFSFEIEYSRPQTRLNIQPLNVPFKSNTDY